MQHVAGNSIVTDSALFSTCRQYASQCMTTSVVPHVHQPHSTFYECPSYCLCSPSYWSSNILCALPDIPVFVPMPHLLLQLSIICQKLDSHFTSASSSRYHSCYHNSNRIPISVFSVTQMAPRWGAFIRRSLPSYIAPHVSDFLLLYCLCFDFVNFFELRNALIAIFSRPPNLHLHCDTRRFDRMRSSNQPSVR